MWLVLINVLFVALSSIQFAEKNHISTLRNKSCFWTKIKISIYFTCSKKTNKKMQHFILLFSLKNQVFLLVCLIRWSEFPFLLDINCNFNRDLSESSVKRPVANYGSVTSFICRKPFFLHPENKYTKPSIRFCCIR